MPHPDKCCSPPSSTSWQVHRGRPKASAAALAQGPVLRGAVRLLADTAGAIMAAAGAAPPPPGVSPAGKVGSLAAVLVAAAAKEAGQACCHLMRGPPVHLLTIINVQA